eukprot:COSAG06_NODE_18231_length_897_cov_1.161654_1_plen_72_part_10
MRTMRTALSPPQLASSLPDGAQLTCHTRSVCPAMRGKAWRVSSTIWRVAAHFFQRSGAGLCGVRRTGERSDT